MSMRKRIPEEKRWADFNRFKRTRPHYSLTVTARPGGHAYEQKWIHHLAWKSLSDHVAETRDLFATGIQVPYDHHHTNPSWTGRTDVSTLGGFLDAVSQPWEAGMEQVKKLTEQLCKKKLPSPVTMRRKKKWDQVGDHYDLDRHRTGAEPWRASYRQVRQGPRLITLLCNVTGHCGLTSEQIAMTGVATAALSNLLESSGFSVRILAMEYIRDLYDQIDARYGPHRQNRILQTWEVKPPGRPVAFYSVVNAISPWFFRMVAWSAHYMQEGWYPGDHQGRPTPLEPEALALLEAQAGSNAVFLLEFAYDLPRALHKIEDILASIRTLCGVHD